MAIQLSTKSGTIKLIFDARARAPREYIKGVVEIDFPQVRADNIDSIEIKFTGIASTVIWDDSEDRKTLRSVEPVISSETVLWQKDSYPEPGVHIIRCPFTFYIPTDAPGSLFLGQPSAHANVSYGLEVIARRPGTFKRNRRVGTMFPVQHLANEEQVLNAHRLRHGWEGPWKTVEKRKTIRRTFLGKYCDVQAQLVLPELPSFPNGIPIPISLTITTWTKSTSSSRPDTFPTPTTNPTDICFQLDSNLRITAEHEDRTVGEPIHGFAGFSYKSQHQRLRRVGSCVVKVEEEKLNWVPDNDSKTGRWQRQVQFNSTIELAAVPTLKTELMNIYNFLCIEIPFPGIGNNLIWNVPIHVNSGVGEFNPDVPPPVVDLPPAYFSGEHHAWGDDEKEKA